MNEQDKQAFEKWFNQPVDQMLPPSLYRKWLDSEEDCTNYFIEQAWQAALEYERAREKEVYVSYKELFEMERARSKKLVEGLESYEGKTMEIKNGRGRISVFDMVTVYVEEDEVWLVGAIANRALAEYRGEKEGV